MGLSQRGDMQGLSIGGGNILHNIRDRYNSGQTLPNGVRFVPNSTSPGAVPSAAPQQPLPPLQMAPRPVVPPYQSVMRQPGSGTGANNAWGGGNPVASFMAQYGQQQPLMTAMMPPQYAPPGAQTPSDLQPGASAIQPPMQPPMGNYHPLFRQPTGMPYGGGSAARSAIGGLGGYSGGGFSSGGGMSSGLGNAGMSLGSASPMGSLAGGLNAMPTSFGAATGGNGDFASWLAATGANDANQRMQELQPYGYVAG